MVTREQLQAAGVVIEDMAAEWGASFAGQYRWLSPAELDDDGFGAICASVEEAWNDAVNYFNNVGVDLT